ncbi:hypothetical protein PTKIN_Ptkin13bG0001500 [Pterospermum kingtungense]
MAASGEDNKHLPYQDSDDDFFYDDDDDQDEEEAEEEEEETVHLEEVEIDNNPRLHDNFIVLKEADIRQRIEDNIAEVSAVLSISKVEASILLLHYNWSVNKIHDAWFADEKQARQKAGLLLKPLVELPDDHGDILCGICFETYPLDGIKSTVCGHPYCNDCWSSYIKTAIAEGPGSLLLKCPEPSCRAAVGKDMIGLFASEEEKNRYSGYFVMSYIEENKMIKWCPGPGCGNAIDFVAGSENFQVSCLCSHSFCWNCGEEAHSPVDCETVTKWMLKNNSEAENVNYILAFTKPCPKCKRPIEKSMGCNHMTCRAPCYFQFCWLCLTDHKNHSSSCNRYRENTEISPDMERREKAKKYVMRYAHYFERWATNKKSMQKVAADLQNVQHQQIAILAHIQGQEEAQLSFLTEAWQQIVECRRVLTWTYAYGYYLSDEEPAKRSLFEYLQGQAESGLERLHHCAEKELQPLLEDEDPKKFTEFREKLSGLTSVTRNYFQNLVTALQNGLSDVKSQCSSSVPKRPKIDRRTAAGSLSTNVNYYPAAAISNGPWTCAYCTYINENSAASCSICGRGSWTCDFCTFANLRTATTCTMCSEFRKPI